MERDRRLGKMKEGMYVVLYSGSNTVEMMVKKEPFELRVKISQSRTDCALTIREGRGE